MIETPAIDGNTSFLNFFRALAALWVAIAHCLMWGGDFVNFPDPKQAVDLFLVISGFLMIYTVDRSSAGWRSFYIRRFARIAPAYCLSLMVVIMFAGLMASGFDLLVSINAQKWSAAQYPPGDLDLGIFNVFLHLTFLFGFSPEHSSSTGLPDWSLALEVQFYAAFPLFFLMARSAPLWLTGAAAAAAAIVLTKLYSLSGLPAFEEPSFLLFKLPYFLAGMMIYEGRKSRIHLGVALLLIANGSRAYGLEGLILVAASASLAWFWLRRSPAFFAGRLVTFASDASYSLYLFHGPVMIIVGSRIITWCLGSGYGREVALGIFLAAVLTLSYAIAWLSHRFVERPGMAAGRRVASRLRGNDLRSPAAAPARREVVR
jgi:peptidoglycan/LPS O-acetylase OafA/YrhL